MFVLTLMSGRMILLHCCIINFTQQKFWQLQLVKLTLQQSKRSPVGHHSLDEMFKIVMLALVRLNIWILILECLLPVTFLHYRLFLFWIWARRGNTFYCKWKPSFSPLNRTCPLSELKVLKSVLFNVHIHTTIAGSGSEVTYCGDNSYSEVSGIPWPRVHLVTSQQQHC